MGNAQTGVTTDVVHDVWVEGMYNVQMDGAWTGSVTEILYGVQMDMILL